VFRQTTRLLFSTWGSGQGGFCLERPGNEPEMRKPKTRGAGPVSNGRLGFRWEPMGDQRGVESPSEGNGVGLSGPLGAGAGAGTGAPGKGPGEPGGRTGFKTAGGVERGAAPGGPLAGGTGMAGGAASAGVGGIGLEGSVGGTRLAPGAAGFSRGGEGTRGSPPGPRIPGIPGAPPSGRERRISRRKLRTSSRTTSSLWSRSDKRSEEAAVGFFVTGVGLAIGLGCSSPAIRR